MAHQSILRPVEYPAHRFPPFLLKGRLDSQGPAGPKNEKQLFNSWRSNVEGADREACARSHGNWIRERNEQCGLSKLGPDASLEMLVASKPCMIKAYKERKEFYDSVMWNPRQYH